MASDNPTAQREYLLEMTNVSKSFPGVKALDNVNLKVRPHSVHALMGENGAGKSTLLKCLFGIYKKDTGSILFQGEEVDFKSSKEALENGVSMVHQELNLVLQRTVMDNMWLGRYPQKGPFVDQEKNVSRHQSDFRRAGYRYRSARQSGDALCFADADDRNRQGVLL
ncbi:ATP-binding cassette domain-containing protein [Pantoea tagorei]